VNHPNSEPLAKENITFPPGAASFVKEIHSAPLKNEEVFQRLQHSQTPSSISIVTRALWSIFPLMQVAARLNQIVGFHILQLAPQLSGNDGQQNSGGADDSSEFSTVPH
jgi:hypothetical protein